MLPSLAGANAPLVAIRINPKDGGDDNNALAWRKARPGRGHEPAAIIGGASADACKRATTPTQRAGVIAL